MDLTISYLSVQALLIAIVVCQVNHVGLLDETQRVFQFSKCSQRFTADSRQFRTFHEREWSMPLLGLQHSAVSGLPITRLPRELRTQKP